VLGAVGRVPGLAVNEEDEPPLLSLPIFPRTVDTGEGVNIEDVVLTTPLEVNVTRTGMGEFAICGWAIDPGSSDPGCEVGEVKCAGFAGDPP
jgi:hypothetical protein